MAEAIGLIIIEAALAQATTWGTVTVISGALAPATVATIVGSAVLAGGAIAGGAILNSALGAKSTDFNAPKPSDGMQTLKQAIAPRLVGFGRARIAGSYVLYDSGSSGTSWDVIALHYGTIGGFVHYYLSDDLAVRDNTTGYVSRAVDLVGPYQSNVRILTRTGLATETAYTEATTAAISMPWTAAHRGDGIASALLECNPVSSSLLFTIYPFGLPKLSVVADLAPIYDPRVGGQSRSDPSTWAVSQNPVLQIMHLLTDTARGMGLDWNEFIQPNLTALLAQADICDELVLRADGSSEKRYRSSGFYYMTNDPVEVIGNILAACDGWMTEGGDGTISIIVGKYATPSITFTDDHIIGCSFDKGVPDEEIVNEIRFTYNAPDNDYREAPGVPWQDTTSIAEIGKVRSQQMAFNWVQSWTQARRLAKRAMLRNQAPLRGTITTTLYGLQALGQRWVRVQSGFVSDLANVVIEVSRARIDVASARCTFEWVFVNPNEIDAWDPSADEGARPVFMGKLTNTRLLGTATGGGALAASPGNAFDVSESSYASGFGTNGVLGKDWGSGVTRAVQRFIVRSPLTRSISDTGAAFTYGLEGSQDAFSWTAIQTGSDVDAGAGVQKSLVVDIANTATAYRYHRVSITFASAVTMTVAELHLVQFVDVTG